MPGAIQPAPEVLLRHGPYTVTLRASLRAAVALDQFPGGFGDLVTEVSRLSLTAIHATIRAAATDRAEGERLLAYAAEKPLAPFGIRAQAACLALLSVILKAGQGEAPRSSTMTAPAKLMPWGEYFASLYRYATGWLGWPPSEVWNASLAELEAAIAAHFDRLVKLTPGAESPTAEPADEYTPERLKEIEAQGFDPAFDREALRTLKARHNA